MIAAVIFADLTIEKSSNKLIYNNVSEIPYNKVGLLLGSSKYLKSGKINDFFANRITAAVELYNAGKIDFIVVSGDNSRKSYNEPLDMQTELMENGVPEERIFLDYAGFRTYDSVIRLNKIFGQNNFTVISQDFHNRRAVYIAKHFGLNAVAYDAKDVRAYNGFLTKVREKFARVKVFVDIFTNKSPKFLGEKIMIE
jgi:SanA protein